MANRKRENLWFYWRLEMCGESMRNHVKKGVGADISHYQSRCGWFHCVRFWGREERGWESQTGKKKKMRISITLLNCFPFLNYCLIFWITINGDFSTKIFELSYFHHIFLVLRRPTTCSGHSKYKNLPSHYNLWLTGGFLP